MPNACARCAQRGPTCCEPEEGVALASLTPGDLARIERASGRSPAEFTVRRVLDAEEHAALDEEDPVLRGLVGPDRVLVSLAKNGRACVFLDRQSGCTLGEAKPLACRRFPFVRVGRALKVRPGGDCLACEEARDLPELMGMLETDEKKLRSLDRGIRRDLGGR
jgi:Fe-S-cluster containining protein